MTGLRKMALVSLIVLPVLLVVVYGFMQTRNQQIRQVYEERQTMATMAAHIVHEKLDHLHDIGISLSTRPAFLKYCEQGRWKEAILLMNDVPAGFPYIHHVLVTDTAGRLLGATHPHAGAGKADLSGQDWYLGVKKQWQPYLSGVYLDPSDSSGLLISLAIPVAIRPARPSCILVVQASVTELLAWNKDIKIGRTGFIYIVDQQGHLAGGPEMISKDRVVDYSRVPAVQKALQGQTGTQVLFNPAMKQERLSAFEQVEAYGWAVIVEQEAGAALSFGYSLRSLALFYGFALLAALSFAFVFVREMSQRKESEKKLSGYAELIDQAPVLVRDFSGRIRFWNKGMEKLYGWTAGEAIGQKASEVFSSDPSIPLGEIEGELQQHGEWQGKLLHSRKDGSRLHVLSHWSLHRDHQGKPVSIVEMNQDISSQIQSEEQLRLSEENNRLMISLVKDYAIIRLDNSGMVASWNMGAAIMKGYSQEEILGKSYEIFYTQADRLAGVPGQNLRHAFQEGRYETEGWRVRQDGTRFWANVVYTALLDDKGHLYGYSKIIRDITEKMNYQEDLESLKRQIDQSTDAIYTVDNNTLLRSWNQGAEHMYGYTREEAIGKNPNDLLQTVLPSQNIREAMDILKQQHSWSGELQRVTKSGKTVFVLGSVSVSLNRDGEVTGAISVNMDITREKQLRKQVDQLALLIDHSTDAIITRTVEGRILTWNKGAENLFGYSREEVLGRSIRELPINDFRSEDFNRVEALIKERGLWQAEMDFYHRNGSHFFGMVTGNGIKNEQMEIEAYIFIFRDITRRRKLEEELQSLNQSLEEKVKARSEQVYKNEKRYRALLENNYDIISLLDQSFTIFYRSPSAERVMGWTNEEMIGIPGTAKVHPDDLGYTREQIAAVLSNPGKKIRLSFRNKHKDGHFLWLEGSVTNLLEDPHVQAIVFNFRDITDTRMAEENLRASEEHYRMLVEQSVDGIFLSDARGYYLDVNSAGCQMLGYAGREDLIGKNISDLIIEAEAERIPQEMARLSGGATAISEWHFRRRDSSVFIGEIIARALPDGRLQAILRDITERKKAETALIQSEQKYRTFIERITVAFIALDRNWCYTYLNKQAGELIGLNPAELIGKNVWDIFPEAIGSPTYMGFHRALKEQVYVTVTDYFEPLDLWQENHIYPSSNGLSVFIRNITESKRAERELKAIEEQRQALAARNSTILNTLPASIALIDQFGCIIEINESWKNFMAANRDWGRGSEIGDNYKENAAQSVGQSLQDREKVTRGIEEVLHGRLREFVHEYPFQSRDLIKWFRMVVSPLRETNQDGAVIMHLDITELRRLEQQRMESKMEEQRKISRAVIIGQEKERNALAQELHDNVNQILAGTKLFLSIAQKDPVNSREHIGASMENLQAAIEENRRLAHRLITPDFEEAGLHVRLARLQAVLKLSGIQTVLDTNGLDEGKLNNEQKLAIYRIVQEQSSNILKYAKATLVTMVLKTEENRFYMKVADNGQGAHLKKASVGIGMRNIKNRMVLLHGEVDIQTYPGQGFSLSMGFPLLSQQTAGVNQSAV